MMRLRKRIPLLLTMMFVLCVLTGCHGSRGMESFVIPEEFDTSRNYEIVFWAKNDTNKTQTQMCLRFALS